MQLGTASAIGLIDFYQYRLSPYKGYACAHRVHYGEMSCSEFAKQAIAANGLLPALPAIRRRLIECREAYGAMQSDQSRVDEEPRTDPSPSTLKQGDTCANICTLPCV